jgi:hypothetical protein
VLVTACGSLVGREHEKVLNSAIPARAQLDGAMVLAGAIRHISLPNQDEVNAFSIFIDEVSEFH